MKKGILSYLWGNFGFISIQCLYSQYPSIQFTAKEHLDGACCCILSLLDCFTIVKSFFLDWSGTLDKALLISCLEEV